MQQRIRCETTKSLPNDPKQMLLSELSRQDREEASRIDLIDGRPIDQRLGASDAYIVLDSTQRNLTTSNPDKGIFSFDIKSEGVTGNQMIGVTNTINNVIEIEMQSFPMPNIPLYTYPANSVSSNSMPVLVPNPGPTGLVFNQLLTNRFMVQIEETSVQSFSDAGGVRHNFEFDVINVNGQLYASPVSPVYVFTDPITSFDRLTLTFRNPPKNISFAEDTMAGARLAINVPLIAHTAVVAHISDQVDSINAYVYNGTAGTIVMNADISATPMFSNPISGTSVDADNSTIVIGQRVLFSNVGGTGANVANGVYTLTSVDIAPNFLMIWTRSTDLDTPVELVKYVSVQVAAGSSTTTGKTYVMISTITDLTTDVQDWVIYSHTLVTRLSVYYPGHRLTAGDRIAIRDLNPKTLPLKVYNYLTRRGGLYVGEEGLTDDYFRFNPDVDMSEFFYTSFTNNYIIKNVHEAQLYGFDTLAKNQIILVPTNYSVGVSPLQTAINYYIPPTQAVFGGSTLEDNTAYKTLTSFYNTAAFLDKEVTANSRYMELQYTGTLDDLTDTYFGIIPQFDSDDFLTILKLTSTSGWATPGGNIYGTASIAVDGSYTTTEISFNTASIVDKDIKNGDYVVFEYTDGLAQSMEMVFGIVDQSTYETISNVNVNWTADPQMTLNDNILFKINTPTQFEYTINGTTTIDTIPAIALMITGDKVLITVAKLTATELNIGITYVRSDDITVLFEKIIQLTVADVDTWLASNKRFYMSSDSSTLTMKSVYKNEYIPSVPIGFYSPYTAPTLPLNIAYEHWRTTVNYPFGAGTVIDGVYTVSDSNYNTAAILNSPIVTGNYAVFEYIASSTQSLNIYFGVIDKDAYESLLIDTSVPSSDWAINESITKNEGILLYVNNDNPFTAPLVITPSASWIPASGFFVSNATVTNNKYKPVSKKYNSAAIMPSMLTSDNHYQIQYMGSNTKYPDAYFGIISQDDFNNLVSPIQLTTKVVWDSPISYGVAEVVDGVYSISGTSYDTASIIQRPLQSGTSTNFHYNGSLLQSLNGYYGFVDKRTFEQVDTAVHASPISVDLAKNNLWTLPSPYVFGSATTKENIYKVSTTKYNTAAIVDYDVHNGPFKFQYIATSTTNLAAYTGYIDQTAYEGLTNVVDQNNWAVSQRLALNEGILFGILLPFANINPFSSNSALHCIINGAHSFIDLGIKIDEVKHLGWIQLQFRTVTATTIDVNFLLYQSDGSIIIDNTRTMTVVNSATWYNNKRAYITTNSKTEKYVSNTSLTDPRNWSISGQLSYEGGFITTILDPTDPSNPYSPNSAFRHIINGVPTTVDIGSTLPSLATDAVVSLTPVVIDDNNVQVTITIYQSGFVFQASDTVDIGVSNSTLWLESKYPYITTNDSTEPYTSDTRDTDNWTISSGLTMTGGFLVKVLSPNDPLNTATPNSGLLIINAGVTSVVDLGSVIPDLNTGGRIEFSPLTIDPVTIAITYNYYQDDGSLLMTGNFNITSGVSSSTWYNQRRLYVTSNNPIDCYQTRLRALIDNRFNGTGTRDNESIESILTSDTNSKIIVSVDIVDPTTLNIDFSYLDSTSTVLAHTQLIYNVEDTTTWFDNKRFYISTNDYTEAYQVGRLYDYVPNPPTTGPSLQIDSNVVMVHDIDSLYAENNWTNLINITNREGILMQLDFTTGVATSFENGITQTMTTGVALSNSQLDTGGFIQIAFTQVANNITYEIVITTSSGVALGSYSRTMAVSNGATWLADITKRYYITTNNTLHTYRSTKSVHAYQGTVVVPTGFINQGDSGYQNYVSDFTNIVSSKSVVVGPVPLPPSPVPRITNPVNAIISLTGQENDSLNRYYQLETLEDIKTTGIRLSENNLIMPTCNFTVEVPSRRFKIPVRLRRILRRITQMSGL